MLYKLLAFWYILNRIGTYFWGSLDPHPWISWLPIVIWWSGLAHTVTLVSWNDRVSVLGTWRNIKTESASLLVNWNVPPCAVTFSLNTRFFPMFCHLFRWWPVKRTWSLHRGVWIHMWRSNHQLTTLRISIFWSESSLPTVKNGRVYVTWRDGIHYV